MNSKGKTVVKVHHKIGAKSMMLALIVHSWTAMAVTTYNYNKYTPINVR